MFSAILLVQDDLFGAALEKLALESKQVSFVKNLDRIPTPQQLSRLLESHKTDLVFLDLSDWHHALAAAAEIHERAPRTAIIGFGAGWNDEYESQCAQAGITELLVSPVTLRKFLDAVDRAIHKTSGAIQDNLLAFLPSKAGSGSTTIAINTAGYLADNSQPDSPARKVLLIDGDLNSGVIAWLLNSVHPYSLRDALENSSHLDYSEWAKLVARRYNVDLLISDHRRRTPLPSWSNYHHLLDFAGARYDHILVDLPEVVNDATVETVRRAKRVFIVCTPEPASLALAMYRSDELTSRGIPREKIGVILNRWHKGEIEASDLEKKLKHSVDVVLGNDYPTVSKASSTCGIVNRNTKLGKSLDAFAKQLAGIPDSPPEAKPSLLKGFSLRTQPQV